MNYADQVGKKIEIEINGTKRTGLIEEYIGGNGEFPDMWDVRILWKNKMRNITYICAQVDRGVL